MLIEIDDKSGFCFGVIQAIRKAEETLDAGESLYSLGEIVHNGMEVKRLHQRGMKTVSLDDFPHLQGKTVLIRAHGEPPETYALAKKYGIKLIDATCPVVLKLQDRIRKAYEDPSFRNAQMVIYGQPGHAEVNGLIGQVSGDAVVVENVAQLDKLDARRPVVLFSQTTKSLDGFAALSDAIRGYVRNPETVLTHDTICRQVAHRKPWLQEFARQHDVIIFVSGRSSSNGKVLYAACQTENARSHMVEDESELRTEWFADCHSVGVCGATSTPRWLMEKIAQAIAEMTSQET